MLSGYLITSLLLAERQATGTVALKAFWGRRARRLLPALALMLLVVALYARLITQPSDLHQIRMDALATIAYVANSARCSGAFLLLVTLYGAVTAAAHVEPRY